MLGILVPLILMGSSPRPPSTAAPVLECRLETAASSRVGEPHVLRLTLENASKRRVHLLRWYTPLEGLRGRILTVRHEGAEIPYRGLMAKRGNPARSDYASIAPGDSVIGEVDLAKSYDLSAAGDYTVEFQLRIRDFSWIDSVLPRPASDHVGTNGGCGPQTVRFQRIRR